MKHLFIPYELAVIAKEKGFNEKCLAHYSRLTNELIIGSRNSQNGILAPVYQQIVDWFEDTHNIIITRDIETEESFCFIIDNKIGQQWEYGKTKQETLNKAIEEAFKLI